MVNKILSNTINSIFMLAAAVTIFPSVSQAQTGKFDIVGIRFGMSPAEVKAAIKAYDPKMTFKDDQWNAMKNPDIPSSLAHIYACGSGPAGLPIVNCPEIIKVQFGQSTQKAHYISRLFGTAGNIEMSTVNDMVLKKYELDPKKLAHHWAYDANGKLRYGYPNDCLPFDDSGPARSTREGCGISVYMNVGSDEFSIKATDHYFLLQDIKLGQAALAAYQKSEKLKQDALPKLAPPKM